MRWLKRLSTLSLAAAWWLGATDVFSAAESGLSVYWVDVEGGAGTLIVTPARQSILIDTGMPGGRDPNRIHRVATEVAGLKKIDFLVTTHLHIDHFGGAAELSQLIPIGAVYDNGIPDEDPDGNRNDRSFPLKIKPYREFKADRRVVIKPGDELPLAQAASGPSLKMRCIAAKQKFIDRPGEPNPLCAEATQKPKDTSDNANSIVMLLEYGGFEFFVGGDLTWNVEAQLVCPKNLVGIVDVYQVNHHGLDQSNNPLLPRALSPTVAVMSNGIRKGCEPQTFQTLKALPGLQAIYQIHRNLRGDQEHNTADEYIANLEEKCQANFIQLRLPAGAREYTVSIPGRGHQKRYQVK